MFFNKNRIIIGLTTFDTEFLRISVPSIAKLKTPVHLIIHNDNPNKKVNWLTIRKLRYFGPLTIINNDKNEGVLKSRLNIISKIKKLKLSCHWIMFADDGDIIKDIIVPNLKTNTFAVMQNMMVVKHSLINLLRLTDNTGCMIDNQDSVLKRPNKEIRGTLLCVKTMINFAELLTYVFPQLQEIENRLSYLPPMNDIMWSYLQMYVAQFMPELKPIYMDKTVYIAIDLDKIKTKYGRNVIPDKNYEKDMMEYYNIFKELLKKISSKTKDD